MAHVIYFDTLAYANKLKEAGVPSKQAEVQAGALAEIFEERVATKQDIGMLKHEIEVLRAEMNVRFAQIETKFSEVKIEMIKWVFSISLGQAALIISVLKFFH